MKMMLEIPAVDACTAQECGYNVGGGCHAKAITIGDMTTPHCDTFMNSSRHCSNAKISAGVGACKIAACKYNDDFECSAKNITVGHAGGEVRCLTYEAR